MMPVTRATSLPPTLAVRRLALQARIHIAREETSAIGRHLAVDLQAAERTRQSLQGGWQLLKASAVAAGVIWSFNASSRIGRGRRFVTLAISLLSTVRAMRKASAFLLPLLQTSERQG